MIAINNIIALIDGSSYSDSVCDHAAWVAQKTDAAVKLVHVLSKRETAQEQSNLSGSIGISARSSLLEELSELDAQAAKLAQKRGRLMLEAATERLQRAGVNDIDTALRHGDFIETVQDFENHADLIVVGKRGENAAQAKAHIGSNLERVVRSSHKPILVAARAYQSITGILLAFDGGKSALKAVQHLAENPLFQGAECHLLTVGENSARHSQQLESSANHLRNAGIKVSTDIQEGEPETAISHYAREQQIDLLVMGAYGHSRIRNLIIGSTTTEMVRSCKIPVLLFH